MQPLLEAIREHPEIVAAALTGSRARPGAADRYSDWDVLLIARDLGAVRDVRSWLPAEPRILICAFHLTHYCSILAETFEKIDLAIFPVEDPPERWVVHDYQLLKGGPEFEAQVAAAAAETRSCKAARLNPDVSIDNILLLLATAEKRVRRGELLSAHSFLGMAADMAVLLEPRAADADLLDPRRRLERGRPELAKALHDCLFVPPDRGVPLLASYIAERHRTAMNEDQRRVADTLQFPFEE